MMVQLQIPDLYWSQFYKRLSLKLHLIIENMMAI